MARPLPASRGRRVDEAECAVGLPRNDDPIEGKTPRIRPAGNLRRQPLYRLRAIVVGIGPIRGGLRGRGRHRLPTDRRRESVPVSHGPAAADRDPRNRAFGGTHVGCAQRPAFLTAYAIVMAGVSVWTSTRSDVRGLQPESAGSAEATGRNAFAATSAVSTTAAIWRCRGAPARRSAARKVSPRQRLASKFDRVGAGRISTA